MEFNNIWKTGDVGAVPKIFKEDYKDWNLLFGGVREGRQPFSDMIKMVFKVRLCSSWWPTSHHARLDCAPASISMPIHSETAALHIFLNDAVSDVGQWAPCTGPGWPMKAAVAL